MIDDCEKAFH